MPHHVAKYLIRSLEFGTQPPAAAAAAATATVAIITLTIVSVLWRTNNFKDSNVNDDEVRMMEYEG